MDQLNNLKTDFGIDLDWYLFQLNSRLDLDFKFCGSFELFWVDKVTTETWSFILLISNFVAPIAAEKYNLLTKSE